ncbi:RrF2 family transcriptional regulator [Dyella mobilis]|uniref:Rrf2 family transcriptional regulator n=1 Tax=Dyella mobilis TaxID=1849582 RepID=A0ABS2KHI4_9GAMM|nr:Rrf2 family transcriptional regulator [Dyella mobilis]MBM7130620.1 Rrf2 family transcriptional regulator [Dyella mobilis]GLQ97247.1 HTH-type transcriptional regulator NsrR [Dyella mobilis]
MRLTYQTDYALRLLMFLAVQGERRSSIHEIATRYAISENHLMKVTQRLAALGYVDALRGRSGGLKLAGRAEDIRIGDVVRAIEPDLAIVECFGTDNQCAITPSCTLRHVLDEARTSFLDVLDSYTLKQLVARPGKLRIALNIVS